MSGRARKLAPISKITLKSLESLNRLSKAPIVAVGARVDFVSRSLAIFARAL
jgi:hypothetical protein